MAPEVNFCFPITRYFHATCPPTQQPVPWERYDARALHVFVLGNLAPKTDLTLSIMEGECTAPKELIEIGGYIDMALDTQNAAERAGSTGHVRVESLEIFGMARDAQFAFRYRLPSGQIRRVQFSLESESKCRQLVTAFQQRGMRFQSKPVRTDMGVSRLGTAQSQDQHRPRTTGASHTNSLLTGMANQTPFRSPETSSGASIARPSSHAATTFKSAEAWPSARSAASGNSFDSNNISMQTWSKFVDNRPCTTATSEKPRMAPEITPSSEPLSLNSQDAFSNSSNSAAIRPSTAASLNIPPSSGFDTVEHEIPPRRELPFKRPESRKIGSAHRHDRSASSTLPMPMSDEQQQGIKPSWPLLAIPQRPLQTKGSYEDRRADNRTAAEPETCAYERIDNFSSLPIPIAKSLHGNSAYSGRSERQAAPRLDSLADAPHDIEDLPESRPQSVRPKRMSDQPTDFPSTARAQPRIIDTGRGLQNAFSPLLDDYAAQSHTDRQAALEQFMMDHLGNPSFTTLCEDMNNSWRKSALGL